MNYKNLFLQQSYLDNYDIYAATLTESAHRPALWDYVILTASNESQAEAYRQQIEYRLKKRTIPASTHYAVLPDHEGKRIGSGGATLGVLKYIKEREGDFTGLRILVIHSGGDSKRVPQYSACGKLFSPVPRELPDGRRSTLFDEFIIGMSGVPARVESGMLVLSGDVLLLFNPLQIDFYGNGAAALSIKESVATGKNHGVFLRDKKGNVDKFLHKQSEQTLTDIGAVDKSGKVNIDTGAILLSTDIIKDLYSLIDTDEKFNKYVNDVVRLSFYADFVYPLASSSTLEDFYNEKPEGEINKELLDARTDIWNILHNYSLKLICLSPASFLHFGTSTELLSLMTQKIGDYRFLNWSNNVCCNRSGDFAAYNSYFAKDVKISSGTYIENSDIEEGSVIGKNCIMSGVTLKNAVVPDGVILHALKLKNSKFVVRMLGIDDNPKENTWMGEKLDSDLWNAPLFAAFDTEIEAAQATLNGVRGEYSLKSSFNEADSAQILPWLDKLNDKVMVDRFLEAINSKTPVDNLTKNDLTPRIVKYLLRIADSADFSLKIRIYYYLAKLTNNEGYMQTCFDTISNEVLNTALDSVSFNKDLRIKNDETVIQLPVRVNWGGGWSDTPPHCLEHGGIVLNAAVTLNGTLPIVVTIKKIAEHKIILSSTDNGSYKAFTDVKALQSCHNPHDAFALHKAALIACGVIPYDENVSVEEICSNIGGGLHLNTEVLNIPRGSGLGTSSILAAACVKALQDFFGLSLTENELYYRVLCMEQIMSTGGGWQDQVGGLAPGIKIVSSKPGIKQEIECKQINIQSETLKELQERFCLIYTGQRRLARNLLREVVGKYIGGNPVAFDVLYQIQHIAELMRLELERGNINGFCKLLNQHWELSKKLDAGCTNTCIDQIFNSIDDMIDGHMICGAGGGGFLQVMLKKGVTTDDLRERLFSVFADSGVDVYDCEFSF